MVVYNNWERVIKNRQHLSYPPFEGRVIKRLYTMQIYVGNTHGSQVAHLPSGERE
jgi:hypothetical protein